MFVLFTSAAEFLIIAMYIGGIPVAEHDSKEPTGTTEDDNRKTTLGKTNKKSDLNHLTLNRAPVLNTSRNVKV